MSDRPSPEEQAETHLRQALKAESADLKDYHIRSALQFNECEAGAETADRAETN